MLVQYSTYIMVVLHRLSATLVHAQTILVHGFNILEMLAGKVGLSDTLQSAAMIHITPITHE